MNEALKNRKYESAVVELVETTKVSKQTRHSECETCHSELVSESPVKMVRLGDVCEIIMGTSPEGSSISKNPSNGFEFHQGKIFFGSEYLNKSDFYTNSPVRFAEAGNIIMSVRAPVGDTNITPRKIAIGRGLCTFKTKSNFDNFYLFYYLQSRIEYLKFKSTGSTFKAVNKDVISNLQIPLPPLETQKQIAARLDLCADTIAKHKKLLELHETLVKSQFVKMFGDPRINSLNLPTKRFEDVVKLQRGFDLPIQNRNQSGKYFVYGSNGILDKHDEYKVKAPGIVTGRSGTLGNVYYIFEDYWPLNTTLFSADMHGNNVVYLKYLLEMFDLKRFTEGSGVPTLNRNIVHQKQIIDVPLALQQKFASFVLQVEKSKFAVQKSLEKAEILYKALMQKYFG